MIVVDLGLEHEELNVLVEHIQFLVRTLGGCELQKGDNREDARKDPR